MLTLEGDLRTFTTSGKIEHAIMIATAKASPCSDLLYMLEPAEFFRMKKCFGSTIGTVAGVYDSIYGSRFNAWHGINSIFGYNSE